MTGVQLRANLEGRIHWHQSEIRRMAKQLKAPDRSLEECPYPDSVLEGEIRRAERHIEVLTFIREYIVVEEIYRLGEFDLRFADLLPEDDAWECDGFAACATGAPQVKRSTEPH
jgi:hypothetical protein